MLIPPHKGRELTVVGIDPGTTTLGLSHLTLGGTSKKPYILQSAVTLKARNKHPDYPGVALRYGELYARLQQLRDQLLPWLLEVRPHVIVCESPFMGRFAQSFAALVECLLVIRQTCETYDLQVPFILVDPITAKKAVGVDLSRKGKRKKKLHKDHVSQALKQRRDVEWLVPLAELDEHAVDATAVGLYFLLEFSKEEEPPCRS